MQSIPPLPRPPYVTPLLYVLILCIIFPHPFPNHPFPFFQCLRAFASMHGRKNILKKLDYDTLQIVEVNFLPPPFDGDLMFVLPQLVSFSLIRRPNPWMAWTNTMAAMFGPRPRPPISPMTWALFFAPPLALATSSAKILSAITFNVLIGPPRSMILISMALPRSPASLVVPCLCIPL